MIASLTNQKVKWIEKLNRKAGFRRKEDVFTAEGVKMFLEAPLSAIREVYLSESFANACEKEPSLAPVREKLKSCRCETAADFVFEKMSDTQTPQGILCVLGQSHYTLEDMLKREETPLFLLLEDLQDPGNLGTILRAGEGAGISGVIMSRDTVDLYNPKTIRATMGSVYRVPFLYTDSLRDTAEELKRAGVAVYAAHLKGSGAYDTFRYREACGFLIGNEANGLKEETARAAKACVRIPMKGKVESLNAAVASALLLYEAARQRREK